MRLIIAGSRGITDYGFVSAKLDKITRDVEVDLVISGGARGVDLLGEAWATANEIPIARYEPDWGRYGRGAGYRRNELMAAEASHLIAVWDGKSRGTKHMIDIARKKGLAVRIVRADMEGAT